LNCHGPQAAAPLCFCAYACPGDWTVHDAHHVAEDFESDIRTTLGSAVTVFTHIEPVEDELSMEDMFLDR
jgi:divalent metal cation (Fe/Co/Zn/Cd) transporter